MAGPAANRVGDEIAPRPCIHRLAATPQKRAGTRKHRTSTLRFLFRLEINRLFVFCELREF
jgi:hypothetical protein